MKDKNIQLMVDTNKDMELLQGVYGDVSNYKSKKV
jgi:spore coat polysaccharide biosynthesis protein SpsF (cytidylyltransferase family)